jgi:hypothetical protein
VIGETEVECGTSASAACDAFPVVELVVVVDEQGLASPGVQQAYPGIAGDPQDPALGRVG